METSSLETQSTWSGSEGEKPRELLESELLDLRAQNKENEQEIRRLRQLFACAECRRCTEKGAMVKYETSVQLEHELQAKDAFIAQLEQKLGERSQQLVDELSKRKTAQYKQIHDGQAFCSLLSQISSYQAEISRLQSENLSLRHGSSAAPEEKLRENSPQKRSFMAGMHNEASTFSPPAKVQLGEAPLSARHSQPSKTSPRNQKDDSLDCGPRGDVGVRPQHVFRAVSISVAKANMMAGKPGGSLQCPPRTMAIPRTSASMLHTPRSRSAEGRKKADSLIWASRDGFLVRENTS